MLGLVLLAPHFALGQREPSADERFLAGLRQRGLYALAERFCTQALAEPELSASRRALLTIELSLTLADEAVSSPPEKRPPLWQRAQQVVDELAAKHPESPRLIQVRLQSALNALARGELARQEAELSLGGQGAFDEARAYLRAAIKQLREVAQEAETMRRQLGRDELLGAGASADRLSARQLESILENVRYELARALRNQGQCYAEGSADRADALNQAVELLHLAAGLDAEHPLAWPSRIDQIVCYRLLGDFRAAYQRLEALAVRNPPPSVTLRARAEEARLALAENAPAKAIQILSAGRELDGVTSPHLDLAILETLIAEWKAAREAEDQEKAETLYRDAAHQVRRIERQYGPYWMRRAETLLAGSMGGATESGDLASLVRAAEGYYRSQRPDDALAAYDLAFKLARAQRNRDRAFELGYIAATIEHQRGRHEQALTRYRSLAIEHLPDHPKAPLAHQVAIQHAAELARSGDQEDLERYASLLAEHRRTWPREPSTDRVRWRAARLAELNRDWPAAIEAYREISPSDPDYAEAVRATGRCCERWLAERKAEGKPVEKTAAEAAAWFESVITGTEGRLPERWSPAQQAAALVAARLWLDHTSAGHVRAGQILSAALEGASDAGDTWRSDARSLLVYSLAASGRGEEAVEVLEGITAGNPEQILVMLDGLSRLAAGAAPEVREEIAGIQLRAVGMLESRKADLGPAVQRMLARIHAQALADDGQTGAALAAFQSLAERYPRDARIQEGYAQLLLGQPDRPSLEAALARWRELERNTQEGSDLWFRAKYGVALAHARLGHKQKAAQILTQLEVLHPELGGEEMAARFRDLLRRCR